MKENLISFLSVPGEVKLYLLLCLNIKPTTFLTVDIDTSGSSTEDGHAIGIVCNITVHSFFNKWEKNLFQILI